MTFTDDDLKRLKNHIDFQIDSRQGYGFDIDALIARLETSESALTELYSLGAPITEKGLAWRKVSGKDSDSEAGK